MKMSEKISEKDPTQDQSDISKKFKIEEKDKEVPGY
jgi:hypothetical protein